MTAIAILAATTALLGWLLYRQHGKTRATREHLAETHADWLEALAAAKVASACSYRHAVAAEQADRRAARAEAMLHRQTVWMEAARQGTAELASRSLPAAPFRTADPDIAAKPFRGKFVPPCGDEGVLGLAVVTPIKRRRS